MGMEKNTKFIAIVGGIAVGKTTIGHSLLKILAPDASVEFIEEDVAQNVFLKDFYSDMKKWAFHSRISTLAMIASNYLLGNRHLDIILMDRCLNELITFAKLQFEKGNLSEREFRVYETLYNCIVSFAPQIDGYIYCYCDPQMSVERIKRRNREFEREIDIDYINKLNKQYDDWADHLNQGKIFRVDTGQEIDLQKVRKFIFDL